MLLMPVDLLETWWEFFNPQTLAVSSACGSRVNVALDQDIVETCICKLHLKNNHDNYISIFNFSDYKQSLRV